MSSNGGKDKLKETVLDLLGCLLHGLYLNWPFVFHVNNLNYLFVSYSISRIVTFHSIK